MCPVSMCTSVLCVCTSVCVCVSVGCTYLCVSVCLNHCVSCRGGGAGRCQHPDWVNRYCLGFLYFRARRKGLHLGEGAAPTHPPHPAALLQKGAVCIRLGFQAGPDSQGRARSAPSEVTIVVLRLPPPLPPRTPEVSVKKPPQGQKPGRLAGGLLLVGLGLGGAGGSPAKR